MSRFLRSGPARPFLLLLAAAVALVSTGPARSIAAPAKQDASAATATATAPVPTPTPSPADLGLAAKFAQDGKLDEAAGAYLAVIARGKPVERLASRLALAQVYRNEARYSLAAHQLDAYLLEAPANADVRSAQFMLAATLLSEGDYAGALSLFDAYIQAGGGGATYARFGRAEALASLGQAAQAASEAGYLLNQDLPSSVRVNFTLQIAQAFEATSPHDALDWYDRLRNESSSPSDQALALWRSAQLSGDVGTQYSAWVTILKSYPDTPTAQEIIDQPLPPIKTSARIIEPYYPALVYYYNGQDDKAREGFQLAVDQQDANAASAAFYLGVLDERDGATNDAIDHYGRVAALDPQSSLADDALWWQGRLLEQAGRADQASSVYNKLVASYPGSSFADEARFRIALLSYDAGRAREAADAFAAIAKPARDTVRQRSLLWQGKALAAAGDEKGARAVWQTLRKEAPADYYGLRAAVLLGDARGRLKDAGIDSTKEPDWAAIEAWLKSANGGELLLARQSLFGNPHWSLGNAMLSVGMTQQADAEFGLLLDRSSGDAALLLELARFFRSAGMIDRSSQAAARLLKHVPEAAAEGAPLDLWRLAYPAPFSAALREAADAEKAPDVLLLALVRQESFFDPLAGSPAGATGLTQVVPPTGQAIAQDLHLNQFQPADLFRPAVSLRFGAHYLRQQLDTFDGDVYAALAAYNGGPGNALRWQRAAHGDVDRFVAEIDYAETVTYVQLVTENLAHYRQLYEGLAEPSLPRD
jgi:soluble lytic murein transglycosylase